MALVIIRVRNQPPRERYRTSLSQADIPVSEQKTVKKESGLEYIETRIGTGEPAKVGSKLKVFYTGTLRDGKKFDGNVGEDPMAVTIGETRLISGFAEGLLGIKKGGKRKILVPYKIGYGDSGSPPKIPPKADLIFDLEVTEVVNR